MPRSDTRVIFIMLIAKYRFRFHGHEGIDGKSLPPHATGPSRSRGHGRPRRQYPHVPEEIINIFMGITTEGYSASQEGYFMSQEGCRAG